MESKFVTLTSEDQDFESYLKGTFSSSHRAVPLNSWNINTRRERVTFQILSLSEASSPSLFKVLWKGIRPELFSLSLGPYLAALFFYLSTSASLPLVMFMAPLALIFLHSAVFLFNDYYDHLRGVDRINRLRGSQVIQLGWIPAYKVKVWAWVFFLLAALFGLPVLLSGPPLLWLVGSLALLAVLGFSFLGRLVKHRGWGDALIFLCFGPLMTSGATLMLDETVTLPVVQMGLVFGFLALLVFHIRQFETLMSDSQERAATSMARWGFDRGKRYVSAEYVALLALAAWSFYRFWPLGVVLLVNVAGLWWPLVRRVRQARSPLSSQLQRIGTRAARFHFLSTLIILVLFLLDHWMWPQTFMSWVK